MKRKLKRTNGLYIATRAPASSRNAARKMRQLDLFATLPQLRVFILGRTRLSLTVLVSLLHSRARRMAQMLIGETSYGARLPAMCSH